MTARAPADPGLVAVAGDWHGNLAWALKAVKAAHDAGAAVVLQLGDFGYWRPDPSTRKYLFRLERQLSALDVQLLWVDGNHEDHARLSALPLAADGTRPISDHIAHLPRGHRWTWDDAGGIASTWLALGGAVSLDRQWRRAGKTWWPEETINEDDAATAVAGGPADVLVSHDSPAGVAIPDMRAGLWPAEAVADADRHRARLRRVVDEVCPRQLWHGHYHVRYDGDLEILPQPGSADEPTICQIHGLDRDDTEMSRNVVFVTADGRLADL